MDFSKMMCTANLFEKDSIVAIIRGVKPEEAVDVAQTMYDAGIRIVEVPLNSPSPFLSISRIAKALGDKMLVGAGTVLSENEVKQLHDSGGKIVVSPNVNQDVIRETKNKNMLSFPGVMTVTECLQAIAAGADGLKIFPAGVVGMPFIKAAKVILPKKLPIIAVGGVDEENILQWKAAGADGYGLGSSLYKPGMSLDAIFQNSRAVVEKLRS
jgi:2-dehydro-3-deoxyphosphogalactonate aldolase